MKDYVLANKHAYDSVADEYLERAGKSTESLDQLVGKPLARAQQKFATISALEIGPGSGEVCAYLAGLGCETITIDVSDRILDNVRGISPTTRCIEADILTYDIGENDYELIYCGALIHLFTLEDAARVMRRVHKALKKDGILFINTTIHEQSDEGYYEKHDYANKVKRFRHRYTRKGFEALIEDCGLTIVDESTTDESHRGKYWLGYICRK